MQFLLFLKTLLNWVQLFWYSYLTSRSFGSGNLDKLPNLVEDIVQTSINTGPKGAIRLAQGIQAFVAVGGEWLADVSQVVSFFYSFFFGEYEKLA